MRQQVLAIIHLQICIVFANAANIDNPFEEIQHSELLMRVEINHHFQLLPVVEGELELDHSHTKRDINTKC